MYVGVWVTCWLLLIKHVVRYNTIMIHEKPLKFNLWWSGANKHIISVFPNKGSSCLIRTIRSYQVCLWWKLCCCGKCLRLLSNREWIFYLAHLKKDISWMQTLTKSFNTTAYYLEHDGIVEGFRLTFKTVLKNMLQGAVISRIDTYMVSWCITECPIWIHPKNPMIVFSEIDQRA